MTKQKQTEEKESNKGSFRDRYKKCLSELKKIPTVNIKGKKYSTVGLRLFKLREYFGTSITISTDIIENTDDEYSVKDVEENGKTISKKYISKYGKICVEAKIFFFYYLGWFLLNIKNYCI